MSALPGTASMAAGGRRSDPRTALLHGWGRFPVARCRLVEPRDEEALRRLLGEAPLIARGNGRSYGDSALQAQATVVTAALGRRVTLHAGEGVIEADSGTLLADMLDVSVPQGWFLPVTPGTKLVTLGGAIAADVHGKNHHRVGSFGRHVLWLDLLCGDGEVRRCSAASHGELFDATLGGMGLTGVILRAAVRLHRIETAWIHQECVAAPDLEAIFDAFEHSSAWTYTVAWLDALARGPALGRSLLLRGEHARLDELPADRRPAPLHLRPRRSVRVPSDLPQGLLNGWTARAFNTAHWTWHRLRGAPQLVDYDRFFYPLDALLDWNRLYGRRGLLQYQCVVPVEAGRKALPLLLREIGDSGQGSFLAVLKLLGRAGGGLSFPMPGYTLALDFPRTPAVLALLERLDAIVLDHGGRLYLAKDARMSAATFARSYPALDRFDQVRHAYGASGVFRSHQSERLGLS